MPCLIGLLALGMPRLAIVLVVVFSDYIGRAYQTTVWPLLGFFFLPLTTLAYAWGINSYGSITGWAVWMMALAFVLDLGFSPLSFLRGKKKKA